MRLTLRGSYGHCSHKKKPTVQRRQDEEVEVGEEVDSPPYPLWLPNSSSNSSIGEGEEVGVTPQLALAHEDGLPTKQQQGQG